MKKYALGLKKVVEDAIKDEDINIAHSLLAKHGKRFRIEEDVKS